MFKLCFFVPDSHLESVKSALFEAGAGRIGLYDQCCWQVLGHGQFRPLPGSEPHLGSTGALECLEEWKVELVVEAHRIQQSSPPSRPPTPTRRLPTRCTGWRRSRLKRPGSFRTRRQNID